MCRTVTGRSFLLSSVNCLLQNKRLYICHVGWRMALRLSWFPVAAIFMYVCPLPSHASTHMPVIVHFEPFSFLPSLPNWSAICQSSSNCHLLSSRNSHDVWWAAWEQLSFISVNVSSSIEMGKHTPDPSSLSSACRLPLKSVEHRAKQKFPLRRVEWPVCEP